MAEDDKRTYKKIGPFQFVNLVNLDKKKIQISIKNF